MRGECPSVSSESRTRIFFVHLSRAEIRDFSHLDNIDVLRLSIFRVLFFLFPLNKK